MNILYMSMLATILILSTLLVRALASYRLPRMTFLILWGFVLFRLLVPISIPMPFGAPTPMEKITALMPHRANTQAIHSHLDTHPINSNLGENYIGWVVEIVSEGEILFSPQGSSGDLLLHLVVIIWVAGMTGLALVFIVTHLRCRKQYEAAIPVSNTYINEWMREQKLRRSVQVRTSDRISTPMTYGVWKPIILLPENTDLQNEATLRYVLTHELTHIRRFDILSKWLLAVALCVHWFNPLVWVMYFLANRDIEIACDESVVRAFGDETKSAYALALIGFEERRGGFLPLYNNFAKNAIKERIVLIMKQKRKSAVAKILAILLVGVIALGTVFVNANTSDAGVLPPASPVGVISNEYSDDPDPMPSVVYADTIVEAVPAPYVHYYSIFITLPNPLALNRESCAPYVHYYTISHTLDMGIVNAVLESIRLSQNTSSRTVNALSVEFNVPIWTLDELVDEHSAETLRFGFTCSTCGGDVSVHSTTTFNWIRTTTPPIINRDGTRSYEFSRTIVWEWRCDSHSCRIFGQTTSVEVRWFNSLALP